MGVADSMRQTFDTLVVHTPHTQVDFRLPWTFSTFDYRELCGLLFDQCDAEFETAKVEGARAPATARSRRHRPRRRSRPARRRRPGLEAGAGAATTTSRPTRRSRAGSRCIRAAAPTSSRSGSTAATSRPATRGASPPRDEVRIGVGSFDPRFHVKEPTVRLAEDLDREAVRYQGNWIPHKLRHGDRGRGLLRRRLRRPLPAADRRGHPHRASTSASPAAASCGAWSRAAPAPRRRSRSYGAFSARHEWQFEWMLRIQRLVPRVPPRLLAWPCAGWSASASSTGRSATTCGSPPVVRAGSRPGARAPSASRRIAGASGRSGTFRRAAGRRRDRAA